MSTWTRSSLKERAKEALHRSYWKMVLVAFIVSLVTGGGGGSSISSNVSNTFGNDSGSSSNINAGSGQNDLSAALSNLGKTMDRSTAVAMGVVGATVLIVILVVFVVAMALRIFLINPFTVGSAKYFNRGLVEEPPMRELVCGYEGNYLNSVKIIFLKDLFVSLWSLLFIIPGIVKSYEYRMVPYILGENPDMPSKEVFEKSREMMQGQKWATFVLDLSFLGWWILAACTCGIVGIFWVSPYYYLTDAALYRQLSGADYSIPQGGYYNQAAGYSQPNGYNQNGGYDQTAGYNQPNGYNQNGGYDQTAGYNQPNGYNQNGGYDQTAGYSQPNGYNQNGGYDQTGGYNQPGSYDQTNAAQSGMYNADYYNMSDTEDTDNSSEE